MLLRSFIKFSGLVFITISCTKDNRWDCFKSYGSTVSEIRKVPDFVQVQSNDKVNVTIYQGNEQKVEVLAGKNIIKNIKTNVVGSVLIIEDQNVCNFVRGYKHHLQVNITVPYLQKVENNSVATMIIDAGFRQDSIFIRAGNSGDTYVYGRYKNITTSSHGNGDIYLSGFCHGLSVYAYGTNFLQAYDLTVKNYIFVANLSLGDCNINAFGTDSANLTVNYEISSSGNIHYKGNPYSISGKTDEGAKGQLIKVN